MSVTQIHFDLPCSACEYNLRGLCADGRCPECGYATLRTIEVSASEYGARAQACMDLLNAHFASAVRTSGATEAAVVFIEQAGILRIGDAEHVGAREFCLIVRQFAIESFGQHAKTWMIGEGIKSSEDIGRIVMALVDHGFMQKSESDKATDFNDLFTIDSLFEARPS